MFQVPKTIPIKSDVIQPSKKHLIKIPSSCVLQKIDPLVMKPTTLTASARESEIMVQVPKTIPIKSDGIEVSKKVLIKLPSSCVLRKIDPLLIKPTSTIESARPEPKESEIMAQVPKTISIKSDVIQTSKKNLTKIPFSCVSRKNDPWLIIPTTPAASAKISEIVGQAPNTLPIKSRVIQASKKYFIKLPSSCVLQKIDLMSTQLTSASIPSIKIASLPKSSQTTSVTEKGIKTNTETKSVPSLVGLDKVPDKIHAPSHNTENSADITTALDVVGDLEEEPSKNDSEDAMEFSINEYRKKFICEICSIEFPNRSRYHKHIQTIHRNKHMHYLCPLCTAKFFNYPSLLRHVRDHRGTTKTSVDSFICDICGSVKKNRSTLENHIRSHSENRDFKCNICPASFKNNGLLKKHLERHTGVKKYKCDLCEAAFFDCADYKRHLAKHGLLEKNFHCSICDSKFYERKLLRYHLKKVHSICDGDELKFLPEVERGSRYRFIPRPPRKIETAKDWEPPEEPEKPYELSEQDEVSANLTNLMNVNIEGGNSDNESFHSDIADESEFFLSITDAI